MKKKSVKKTKLKKNKDNSEFIENEIKQEEDNQETKEEFVSLNDTLKLLLEMGHSTNNNIQIIAECIVTIQDEILKIKEENNELKKRLGIRGK